MGRLMSHGILKENYPTLESNFRQYEGLKKKKKKTHRSVDSAKMSNFFDFGWIWESTRKK